MPTGAMPTRASPITWLAAATRNTAPPTSWAGTLPPHAAMPTSMPSTPSGSANGPRAVAPAIWTGTRPGPQPAPPGRAQAADQVQLIVQVVVELGHDLAGLEALAVGRQALDPARHHVHQRQVLVDHGLHAR